MNINDAQNNLTKYLKWIYVLGIMDDVIKNYRWQFHYFEAPDIF